MSWESYGGSSSEFWDTILSGGDTAWSEEETVATLSEDRAVQCVLRTVTSGCIAPDMAEECRGFLLEQTCLKYGLQITQCDAAFTEIERNIMEERANGQT